jgi:hypothetical protein
MANAHRAQRLKQFIQLTVIVSQPRDYRINSHRDVDARAHKFFDRPQPAKDVWRIADRAELVTVETLTREGYAKSFIICPASLKDFQSEVRFGDDSKKDAMVRGDTHCVERRFPQKIKRLKWICHGAKIKRRTRANRS